MAKRLEIQADLNPAGVKVGAEAVKRELNNVGTAAETANRRAGTAATFSGERMARYATSVGMVTGQVQRLGVSNDILARGLGVTGDLVTGMAGPMGILVTVAGGLAVVLGNIAMEGKRAEEALKGAMETLVHYAALEDKTGETARLLLLRQQNQLLEERAGIMTQLERMKVADASGSIVYGTARDVKTGREYTLRQGIERKSLQQMDADAARLLVKLYAIDMALAKINGKPETKVGAAAGVGGGGGGAGAGADVLPYRIRQRAGQEWTGATYGAAGNGAELRRLMDESLNATINIIPDRGAEIVAAWRENVVDPMRQSLADGIYGAFQAGRRGVDDLGAYFLDFFANNILKALSQEIAGSLAGLVPGGGFLSALFTGSFGKDLNGAKAQNAQWRMAR